MSFCVRLVFGLLVSMYCVVSRIIVFFLGVMNFIGMFLDFISFICVSVYGNSVVLLVCIIFIIFDELGMYLIMFGLMVVGYVLKVGLMFFFVLFLRWLNIRKVFSLNDEVGMDCMIILFLYFGLVRLFYEVGGV